MILLNNRSLINLSGDDARKYLQGLITNDIEKLSPETAVYAAMLSPQGKYLFDFIIYEINGDVVLDTDAGRASELVKRLNMYKLRAKVEIKTMPEFNVYYDLENGIIDPRSTKLGRRYVTDEEQEETGSLEEYENLLLQTGIPSQHDLVPDSSYILQNNFEALHGVDFNKGCYVGQEVVARMKYKDAIRKALYKVEAETGLPPFGTEIKLGDKTIGEMRSSQGQYGLAQLEIAAVNDNGQYFSAGKEIKIRPISL